jgi:GNAT superfamily N-acetyltransferase
MAFQVRDIKKEDYKQWLHLWSGYNKFYGRHGDKSLSEEITQATWQRFFDEAEPVHALVAEQSGKLIGLTHYLFHRSTTMLAHTCYLQDLFAEESVRGMGVGTALIQAVYSKAKLAGSPRVYWQTHETNHTAMKLYEKIAERSGFLVFGKKLDDVRN